MQRSGLLTVLVVLTVVRACCASTTGPVSTDDTGATLAGDGGDGEAGGDGAATGEVATVNFYVSDAPIDDFAHLNATVTKVGFQSAGDPGGAREGDEAGEDGDASATPAPNPTTPGSNETTSVSDSVVSTTVENEREDGSDGTEDTP